MALAETITIMAAVVAAAAGSFLDPMSPMQGMVALPEVAAVLEPAPGLAVLAAGR